MSEYQGATSTVPTWLPPVTPTYNTISGAKWQTQSAQNGNASPPTAQTTLTAYPSLNGVLPLYPSVSAQSNVVPTDEVSPTNAVSTNVTPRNGTTPGYPFNATTTATTTAAAGGIAGASTLSNGKTISQSSSTSSLKALSGSMGKLSIAAPLPTPYNPYNGAFTPSCVTTPTGHSQTNTPNPGSRNTPSGFSFNNPYSYAGLAPSGSSGTTPTAVWTKVTPSSLQQTAAINNLNAMQYANHGLYAQHSAVGSIPTLKGIQLQQLHGSQSATSHLVSNGIVSPSALMSTTSAASLLNSSAQPYAPTAPSVPVAAPPTSVSAVSVNTEVAAHHIVSSTMNGTNGQLKVNAVYNTPSYADAVNKERFASNDLKGSLAATNPAQGLSPPSSNVADSKKIKMSAESSEAIQKLNPLTWPCNPSNAKFYVIKSFGEDDVHKSIKYNLWCSTERGNRKLDEAFNESKRINRQHNASRRRRIKQTEGASMEDEGDVTSPDIDARDTTLGCPVYLFFSVNRSGCFCGMAQMISNYYADRHFGSWVQDGKWQGSFIVKWIYVKDIPNKDLKDIQLPNNDGRPVTFSRDTQEIPYAQGVEMLTRFINYEPKTNILQDFKYYDDRERDIKMKRTEQIFFQSLHQPHASQQMAHANGPSNDPPSNGQSGGNGVIPAPSHHHLVHHHSSPSVDASSSNGLDVSVLAPSSNDSRTNSGFGGGRGSSYGPRGGRKSQYGRGRGRGRGHRGRGYGASSYGANGRNQDYRENGRYFTEHSHRGGGSRGGRRGRYRQRDYHSTREIPTESKGGGNSYGNYQILKRNQNGSSSPNGPNPKEQSTERGLSGARGGSRGMNRNRWVRK